MGNRRHTAAAGAALTAAVMVMTSACGNEDLSGQGDYVQPVGDNSSPGPGYGSANGANAPAGSDSGAEPAGALAMRDIDKVGEVVTDSAGMTLYRFDKDTPEPSKSTCNGDCATAWPPVPAEDASASAGIKSADLGKVTRADGTEQLTLGGWPVYRFAKDAEPSDVKGEGGSGTWYALAADGSKAAEKKKEKEKGKGRGKEDENAASDGAQLKAVDDPNLGSIVQDAEGRTLYRFDKDSAWPMESNCDAKCQATWKPAKFVDKTKVEGIAHENVLAFDRPDGTKQLTIDCWPLYWYTGDKEPGDTNGHGVGDAWWAVTPDGKKATKSAGGGSEAVSSKRLPAGSAPIAGS